MDNQSSQKHSQLDTLPEPSAPPYSQQPPSADQEESSAPIDDPIQQQILAAEQDPNSAPIDDDDNISLAAPIYDPTAVAAPYLTYVQEPPIEHVDTSRTRKNRIARIAFIVQLAFFLCVTIYAIVIWSIDYFSDRQNELMPGVMMSMAPVLLYAPLMMAFVNRAFALTMAGGGIATIIICYTDPYYISVTMFMAIGPIMVLLPVYWFYLRRRIPFTSILLKSTGSLLRKHRSINILSYAGLGAQMLLTLFFIMIVCAERCVRGFNTSINKYAFYDVVTYGKAFYPAARDTWSSIESRRIDVILRDFILGNVLVAHALFYGVLCGMIALVISDIGFLYAPVAVWAAMQIVFSAGAAADASAASALVALAKDPLVFAKANPEFFAELREAYPAASFGLMVIIPGVP
ncbi:putative choline transporter, neither null mutation nor overexpression affects choline transport [Podila horticola]|nr:putative choline transporter, neither null mutation nor overexpression affects choline transport [Podila horticola]